MTAREEGVEIGKHLLDAGRIAHIRQNHHFQDRAMLYLLVEADDNNNNDDAAPMELEIKSSSAEGESSSVDVAPV